MMYFLADMEVVDTTNPSDFDLSDCRVFSLTGGPYDCLMDAHDAVPDSGLHFILEYDNAKPQRVTTVHDYEIEYDDREHWTDVDFWSPSNLPDLLYETIEEAIWYRKLKEANIG